MRFSTIETMLRSIIMRFSMSETLLKSIIAKFSMRETMLRSIIMRFSTRETMLKSTITRFSMRETMLKSIITRCFKSIVSTCIKANRPKTATPTRVLLWCPKWAAGLNSLSMGTLTEKNVRETALHSGEQ